MDSYQIGPWLRSELESLVAKTLDSKVQLHQLLDDISRIEFRVVNSLRQAEGLNDD